MSTSLVTPTVISSADNTIPPTTAGPLGFLSLPYEIRYNIFERYLHAEHFDWIDDSFITCAWQHPRAIRLLQVCKTFYNEASPIIYQDMRISCNLKDWVKFLNIIGPHNIAKLRYLTIDYECGAGTNIECNGKHTKEEWEEDKDWAEIFRLLRTARVHSQLKTLVLNVCPCGGNLNPWYDRREESSMFVHCRIYNDLAFLKDLSYLDSVREIELRIRFNPLWASFLRRRLGFIELRHGSRSVTMVNPNHDCRYTDLKRYKESERYRGRYEEIVEASEVEELDTDYEDN
ncbi:hypothetical protein F5Y02DRAFT_197004 [Annulohypoxylon stygium]|nr:hypothetical protein F5Y02DRAFT_197004 [Annulohypoxylon stygium]